MTLRLFKFLIRDGEYVIGSDGFQYSDCLAVVFAEDEEAARARLIQFAKKNGGNTAWFAKVKAQELPTTTPYVVCWST